MPSVLAVNAGSSSLKAALFDGAVRQDFHYELAPGEQHAALYARLKEDCAGARIDAVGHRVTHGGDVPEAARVLDAPELQRLETLVKWAPLHQRFNLDGVDALRRAFSAVHVACFDTAFHHAMPAIAKIIPVEGNLRRYGFHGLAYASVVRQLQAIDELDMSKAIVAHLGSGASLCLIEHGQSRYTTMGLTPLGGIAMGSRSGDLDPGVMVEMARSSSPDALEALLYRKSGLQAVSGLSSDMRALLASEDARARLAVAYFCAEVRAEIGALAARSGGITALVFCGGIGQHSASVRAAICEPLGFLGIQLDDTANARNASRIERDASIPVLALAVDEQAEIRNLVDAALAQT